MTSKSRSRRTRASFPDDVEPEYDFFSSNETSFEHKTHQLCAQVRQSLALQLESEYSDECLQGLYVESVSPHPNASRLLVVLRHWDHRRSRAGRSAPALRPSARGTRGPRAGADP